MRSSFAVAAAAIVASFVAVVLAIVAIRNDRDGGHARAMQSGDVVSAGDRRAAMRSMMGTADPDAIDRFTPSRRPGTLKHDRDGGWSVFALRAAPVRLEYRDGRTLTAWGYNGAVPGPTIDVREGTKVRVVFTNDLPRATTVHWHGLEVPWKEDGVPGVSQRAIEPGASFTYEFTAAPSGTHFYHTHGSGRNDEGQQLDMGLAGAFIVRPASEAAADVEETLLLDEWQTAGHGMNMAIMDMDSVMGGAGAMPGGMGSMMYDTFTINGRSWPDSAPIRVSKGDRVRLRLVNVGSSTTHPMHLHGHTFTVTALDGRAVPAVARQQRNTVAIAPGETVDVEFLAGNPGVWALHCHELHHADGGMMTLLAYDGFALPEVAAGDRGESGGHMMSDGAMMDDDDGGMMEH